jgi:hypothetical protein
MGKKYTDEQVKKLLLNFGYKLISKEYLNARTPLIVQDKNNYLYTLRLENLLKKQHPRIVDTSNPYTIYNIKLWLKSNQIYNNYKLITDKYLGSQKKLILKDENGYYFTISFVNLRNNVIPRFVDKSNPYTIQNINLWCKINNKLFNLLSKEYKDCSDKLVWQCLKEDCKEEFEMAWNNILQEQNCPFCSCRKVGLSNCLATKNPELAKEWHLTKNGNLTPWDVTPGCDKKVWWQCKECRHEWPTKIYYRSSKNSTGCPECSKSKGEKKCKEVFISRDFIEIIQDEYDKLIDINKYNNTYFIPQKTFDGLIGLGGGLLSYDFYIPKYNLLIEFQGEQHERYIKGFHKSKKDFEKQQKHDRYKREYAEQNDIKFLEIWYWQFDKIEEILNYTIKNKLIGDI